MRSQTVMWDLDEARTLIQDLQPKVDPLGYHVCLGGSVLNRGESEDDLDLYFFPLNGPKFKEYTGPKIVQLLEQEWGQSQDIGTESDQYKAVRNGFLYRKKFFVGHDKRRIDVFIFGLEGVHA